MDFTWLFLSRTFVYEQNCHTPQKCQKLLILKSMCVEVEISNLSLLRYEPWVDRNIKNL